MIELASYSNFVTQNTAILRKLVAEDIDALRLDALPLEQQLVRLALHYRALLLETELVHRSEWQAVEVTPAADHAPLPSSPSEGKHNVVSISRASNL